MMTKRLNGIKKLPHRGHADAQCNLGNMYSNGHGVPKDDAKAVEWYQKAAVQGQAKAQNNLGAMYNFGHGVARDLVLSYAWRNLAASQGNEISIKAREALERSLTSAERAEGQRLASNWKKLRSFNFKRRHCDSASSNELERLVTSLHTREIGKRGFSCLRSHGLKIIGRISTDLVFCSFSYAAQRA